MNEQVLREFIAAVKAGRVSRRLCAHDGWSRPDRPVCESGLAQSAAPIEYKPTRAGGGGAL